MSIKYDNIKRECTVCHTGFLKGKTESGNHFLKRVYCSLGCYWESLKGRKLAPFSDEHKKKIGDGNRGKKHSIEQNQKHSEILKGSIPWNKGKKNIYTKETLIKISLSTKKAMSNPDVISKMSLCKKGKPNACIGQKRPSITGINHPAWKGGVSTEHEKVRKSTEYKLWRKAVFARDNYTCVACKATKCELNADHIKPFAFFPELRFAIDNGRTLCVPCHKKTPTYGEGAKKMYKHLVT